MSEQPYSLEPARRGLKHFAIGRVLVGLAGVVLLLLTIRRLSPNDLGSYVSLVALQEIVSLSSSVGLFGFVQRYMPEYRIHGSRRQLAVAIGFSLVGRVITLALACGVLYLVAGELTAFLGLPVQTDMFRLYLLVILLEGSGRFIDHVFEALLMQGATQIANLVRSLVKLGGLLVLVGGWEWTLNDIIVWDVYASSVALVVASVALWAGVRAQPDVLQRGEFDHSTMVRFAAYNYAALLGYQIYGFDTLKLLVSKLIGVAETAAYGLSQSVTDVLRRYLPANLLLGMIRPLIIASYSHTRNMDRPLFLANLVLKLNVFLIAPALAVFIALGDPLLELIGKGRYPQAYGYVLAFMVLLVVQTLHLMLSVLAMTAERNELVMKGTWFAITGAVVAVTTIPTLGAWGALAAAFVSEFAFCLVVSRGLRNVCEMHVLLWREFDILAAIFAVTVLVGVLVAMTLPKGMIALFIGTPLVVGSFFVMAQIWKPFTVAESTLINKLLPKPFFIW